MKKIKSIIFDFGGVLYDIDLIKMMKAFKMIGLYIVEDEIWTDSDDENIFNMLEKGLIDPKQFINELVFLSKEKISEEKITKAFNSVLTGLSATGYEYLKKLCRNYDSYLMSNTNEIHFEVFYNEIKSAPLSADFYDLFKKQYYSFELGLRKPDIEFYKYVITDSGLDPESTLFIDDTKKNVESAGHAGLKTFHLLNEDGWPEIIRTFDLKI